MGHTMIIEKISDWECNCVPINKVNAYLNRNPVMAKAWEDAGWQFDKP